VDAYLSIAYPAVLVVCGALVATGIVTLVFVRAHRVLQWVVTAAYVAAVIQALWIAALLLSGTSADLVVTLGYLLATLALLPLLGIGRLGHPDAAHEDPDPSRPVLAPDQIARVDGAAAIAVGIALAVASWRLTVVLGAGS
jgi:hypothetical protein